MKRILGSLALVGCVGSAWAQDSVSKIGSIGDAVSPWADAATPGGSEQCNDFVVDLASFQSSWGNTFRIAPLIKSSKTGSQFTGSLISAQGISRLQLTDVDAAAGAYSYWQGKGFGVNNDPALNDPGTPLSLTGPTHQFGVTFAEFATTDLGANYNGIIGGVVNYDPADPTRLFVRRIMAAVNNCGPSDDVAQFGVGAVDASGNVIFRADCFGCSSGGCCSNIVGDNIISVNLPTRDCDVLNVIGGDPTCGDEPATCRAISASGVTHSVPNLIPAEAGGPTYVGPNFSAEYVYRTLCGLAGGQTIAHRASTCVNVTDHRGSIGYLHSAAPLLGGNHLLGILGQVSGSTRALNLWSVNDDGTIINTVSLGLPESLGDCDGFLNDDSGVNAFNHYRGPTAFRGGVSQVAIGHDQAGRVLVAAEADHPTGTSATWPLNYIAVARFNPTQSPAEICQNVEWTMAGYIRTDVVGGKPILDGPGGAVIGEMVPLAAVTGGSPLGPSVSAPMIDSVGNVYFLSAMRIGQDFTTGLLRSTYNPTSFCYELELIFKLGDVFPGLNSDTNYRISFLPIAASTSVNSGTAFSQNISQTALAAQDPGPLSTLDSATLGGLVINASITYELGDNDPNSVNLDQSYQVMLYLQGDGAAVPCPGDCDGDGVVGLSDLVLILSNFADPTVGNCPGGLTGLVDVLSNFGAVCN